MRCLCCCYLDKGVLPSTPSNPTHPSSRSHLKDLTEVRQYRQASHVWYQALEPRTTKLSGTACPRACSQPPRPNIGRILRRKILLWLPQDLFALCCDPFFPYLTLFFSQWIWPEYHVVEQGTSLLQYELNGFRRGTSNAWLTQRKRSAILSLAWTIVCACRICLFTQATKHDTASSAAALRLTRKHGDKISRSCAKTGFDRRIVIKLPFHPISIPEYLIVLSSISHASAHGIKITFLFSRLAICTSGPDILSKHKLSP